MQHIARATIATILLAMLSASTTPPFFGQADQEKAAQSNIVFRGTVLRQQDSTLQLVAASPNTVVVRVDEMILPSDSSIDYKGKEITLRVRDPSKFKVLDRAIFYTTGWLLADGVALLEVDHTKVPLAGAMNTTTLATIMSAGQAVETKLLRDRSGSADILIEGRVVSTEPVEEKAVAGAIGGPRPISEHSPQLRKANIEVIAADSTDDTAVPKIVTVLYPASEDVRWQGAPRFERGDKGVFILKKADKSIELKDFMLDLKLRINDIDKYFFGPSQLDFQPNISLKSFNELIKPAVSPGP